MSKLKRLASPKFWPIERKTRKYVVKPKPGPHSLEKSMPLGIILRDVLHYAETMKEAKEILLKGNVKVDGTARKEHNFPAGLMDVLTIGDENYRILAGRRGLYLKNISEKEAGIKLLRIKNKTAAKKGKIQVNFHDGSNKLFTAEDKLAESRTGDTFVFNIQNRNVEKVIRYDRGNLGMIVEGKNVGVVGKIRKIIVTKSSKPNMVTLDAKEKIAIPKDFVFVIGEDKPVIEVGD
jgi:small subunit ribosomal protein S4e